MKRNSLVELITDPTKNFLASFAIGTLVFTIVSDGVSSLFWETFGDWLQAQFGFADKAALRLTIVPILISVLLIFIYATPFARWLRNRVVKFFGDPVTEPTVEPLTATFPGLIAFMSPKTDSPAEIAISHHWNGGQLPHLEHCWLICTEKSLPFAQKLEQEMSDRGLTQKVKFYYGNYELDDLEHPGQKVSLLIPEALVNDPIYIQKLVNSIYADVQKQGLNEEQAIADFTGGNKPMTVGAILAACSHPSRRLQYISQIDPCHLMEVKISYKLQPIKK
ncbi:MAG: hypothetical protein KME17_08460 [Cyanosarcina radialis HA8281-LM2]|jgi:hypothetical protein|nr:hypothetical protein [Cyanosarcina radialis HA8281-LM2]